MSDIHLKHGTWLAICDGRKAMLVENKGDHTFPNLVLKDSLESENPPSHLQGSDKPGRVFQARNGRRAATEESDFHRQAELSFLRQVGKTLEHWIDAEPKHEIVLIAPARALGILREILSKSVRGAITGELARDFVKLPLHEIERHLKA